MTFSRMARGSSRSAIWQIALEEVDHREVGRGLAVRDGAGLENQPAVGPVGVGHLPDEPRFSDAWLADNRHHLAVPLRRATERLAELLQLGVPAHESTEPARGRRGEPRAPGPRAHQLVGLDRCASPFTGTAPSGFTST